MNSVKLQKTELLAVVVCLFVGFFCVYAAAFKSREQAKQVVCASHIRQICQSLICYAADNDGVVTINNAGWWPSDISFSATDDLMAYGSSRQGFYCPANKTANAFDVRLWQYALSAAFMSSEYYTDFDESMLSPSQKTVYYRVVTYLFLTKSGNIPSIQGSPPRDWIYNLDDIANPQEYEMVTDSTISQTSSSGFHGIMGVVSPFSLSAQSNHLNKSGVPFGGNIGFVDGHVGWRPFAQMQVRLSAGLYFWW